MLTEGVAGESCNRLVTKLPLIVILNVVKDLKSKILRFAQNDNRLFHYKPILIDFYITLGKIIIYVTIRP